MGVSYTSAPFLQPKKTKLNVKVEAYVDHEVDFGLEESLGEHLQLGLFFLILFIWLADPALLSQDYPQRLEDVDWVELNVFGELGCNKYGCARIHEAVETMVGADLGLAMQKKKGRVHKLNLGPTHQSLADCD